MSQTDKKIAAQIREIANKHNGLLSFPTMMGTVVAGSVDMSACTCAVLLSVDDADAEGTGHVLLNAVTGNVNGILCFPADGSNVWVAELDGPGKWGIVKTSDLVKYKLTVGSSQLTVIDGTVTVQVGDQTKLTMTSSGHKIEAGGKDLGTVLGNLITHILAMTVSTGTGPSGTALNFSDFISDQSDLNMILV